MGTFSELEPSRYGSSFLIPVGGELAAVIFIMMKMQMVLQQLNTIHQILVVICLRILCYYIRLKNTTLVS